MYTSPSSGLVSPGHPTLEVTHIVRLQLLPGGTPTEHPKVLPGGNSPGLILMMIGFAECWMWRQATGGSGTAAA